MKFPWLVLLVGVLLSACTLSQSSDALPEGMKAKWTIQKIEAESQQNSDKDINFEFVHSIVYDITYFQDGKLHIDFYWWEEGFHQKVLTYRNSVIVVRENQPTLQDYNAAVTQRKHFIRQDMVDMNIDEIIITIYQDGEEQETYGYQVG